MTRPERCWKLKARDKIGWKLFHLIANEDVARLAWRTYADSRDCIEATWRFPNGSHSTYREWPDERLQQHARASILVHEMLGFPLMADWNPFPKIRIFP